jgi:hypothetical protein
MPKLAAARDLSDRFQAMIRGMADADVRRRHQPGYRRHVVRTIGKSKHRVGLVVRRSANRPARIADAKTGKWASMRTGVVRSPDVTPPGAPLNELTFKP